MGLLSKVSQVAKKQMSNIQAAHDRRVVAAEARARRQLVEARTKTEREKAKLALQREKAQLSKELSEARLATLQARAAAEKARKEAGDLTFSERLGVVGKRFGAGLASTGKALAKSAAKSKATSSKKRRSTVVKRRTTARREW